MDTEEREGSIYGAKGPHGNARIIPIRRARSSICYRGGMVRSNEKVTETEP